jgi:hypothetical protein
MSAEPALAPNTALDWDGLTEDDVHPEEVGAFRAMKAFDAYVERTLSEHGGEIICPRCKRPTLGWPLKRPDKCSEKRAVHCMRDPQAVLDDIARRAGRKDGQ